MYQLIIAEDVAIIREMLLHHVNWSDHNIEVCCCVSNGKEALDYLNNRHADILLTDIKMPVLDGLQLIMEAKTTHPSLECVILTAYANFDYAKNAIQLGVRNYILKPIDIDQLLATMDEIVSILDKNTHMRDKVQKYDRFIQNQAPKLSDKFAQVNTEDAGKVKIVEDILSYIDSADLAIMKIGDIAQKIQLNQKYLSTIFKSVTGQNLSHYITSHKMEKAAEYLRQPNCRIYEIAEMLGYSDHNHFRDVFYKHYHMSPAEYKKKVF